MTTPEEETYLAEETKKNLSLIYTPGSRICSEESGNERLVIGDYQDTFLLTVRTNPDGSQTLEPIPSGKLPKVARVIAEGRKYSVMPLEKSESVKNKTPLQAMQIISDVTTKRFKESKALRSEIPGDDENYSDGFYQKPKPDNRGLVIFDLN